MNLEDLETRLPAFAGKPKRVPRDARRVEGGATAVIGTATAAMHWHRRNGPQPNDRLPTPPFVVCSGIGSGYVAAGVVPAPTCVLACARESGPRLIAGSFYPMNSTSNTTRRGPAAMELVELAKKRLGRGTQTATGDASFAHLAPLQWPLG